MGVARPRRRLALRLRYRTDALDADGAARIAGYHLTALALIAADPDAEHGAAEPALRRGAALSARRVSPGRAGSCRTAGSTSCSSSGCAAHPDAVAAVHGDRQWTYRELNARANRLGRALLARGLRREGVVAVVTERNLDWMAAVLAIFKAGGVYLPIEPHFPADRIATMLARAECKLVLTEPGSTATLDQALDTLPGSRSCSSMRPTQEDHADGDLGVEVGAGPARLHLLHLRLHRRAQGRDVRARGHAQPPLRQDRRPGHRRGARWSRRSRPSASTSRCGSWSSALLVGGRTLLVEQEVILDVERFVDTIVDGRVAVLQVVPSYLEVVLSYLEQHPRELPDLRCVSVTGEALKTELVQRWFAAQPGINLVNAYGLTETSDDTNHEVMDRAPDGDRVPLGPAVNNVHVYVVDEHLSPGAAGRPGRDRLLRRLRRPRVRQRSGAHPACLHGRSAPRASGSTGAATTAAGGRTASWSSSAAGTARSRSVASASRSARSRTLCCGCRACGAGAVVVAERAGRGKAWWRSTRRAAPRGGRPAGRLGDVAARVHGPVGLPPARRACR